MRGPFGALSAAALIAAPVGATTPDDAAAIARGQQALAWVQKYACPALGTRLTVAGLATPADVKRVRDENWAFANTRLDAMAAAIRARRLVEAEIAQAGGTPSRSLQQSFEELDSAIAASSARATSALTQWALATWVAMSGVDGNFDVLNGGTNPLQPYIGDSAALRALAQRFGGAMAPVSAKFDQCLAAMQSDVIAFNLPQIRAAADQRRTSQQLAQLVAMFDGIPLAEDSEAATLVADLRSRRDALASEERRQAELARAAADEAARSHLRAEAEAGRAVAARYIAAIAAGRIEAAVALLDDDVFLASPQGSERGKQRVAERMRRAQGQADGATRPSPPEIDEGYRVFSRVQSTRGSGRIFFEFLHGRITRISLVQN